MKLFWILALACLGAAASASVPPVTQSEAAAVFAKADKVVKQVLQVKSDFPTFSKGKGVATREEILRHFEAILKAIQPKIKFTPAPLKSAPGLIHFSNADTRRLAMHLEVTGFIDRFGPLATSSGQGLAPSEFGDALGYFISRVAEVTHMPTSKFSPYLEPGNS